MFKGPQSESHHHERNGRCKSDGSFGFLDNLKELQLSNIGHAFVFLKVSQGNLGATCSFAPPLSSVWSETKGQKS